MLSASTSSSAQIAARLGAAGNLMSFRSTDELPMTVADPSLTQPFPMGELRAWFRTRDPPHRERPDQLDRAERARRDDVRTVDAALHADHELRDLDAGAARFWAGRGLPCKH